MNLISFTRPDPKCSFCKTPRSQCRHMLGNNKFGRDARYICDQCIRHAKQRIVETDNAAHQLDDDFFEDPIT